MPILYILCGLPFSGKTILAKKLAEKFGFEQVSIDEIRFAHGFPWEDSKITAKDWQKIFDESYQRTQEFLQNGKSVLYDSANQDRVSRDRLRKLAKEVGVAAKVIWLDIPLEIIKKRYKENTITQERFHLPEKFFNMAVNTYEVPKKDENVIRYTNAMDFNVWAEENFSDASLVRMIS